MKKTKVLLVYENGIAFQYNHLYNVRIRRNQMTKTGRPPKWTEEDRNTVKRLYVKHGANIPDLLIKYSPRSIESCARRLGIRNRTLWTEEENKILTDKYPTLGMGVIALLPGRSEKAISTRASILGIRQVISDAWTPSDNVKDVDLAYLAGFIDGEGTITVRAPRGKYLSCSVSASNTNESVIRHISQITGSKYRRIIRTGGKRTKHRDIFFIHIGDRSIVMGLLSAIRPYMIVKKHHADLAIEVLADRTERIHSSLPTKRELAIVREFDILNRRGNING